MVAKATLLALLVSGVAAPVQADVLSTRDYLTSTARAEHLGTIDAALARADVSSQLVALGVSPEDARARIAQLPDDDLARLAAEMDELPAGGSVLALIGAVFVVLLILELTGVINIFNKV